MRDDRMTDGEFDARLLQAFKAALIAGQDGIADELEDLVLARMEGTVKATFRGIGGKDEAQG